MTERERTEYTRYANHERSLRAITAEIVSELSEFVGTRVQMAKAEFQETISSLKAAVPLSVTALAFAVTGFLMLTFAAVSLVSVAFAGSPYAWFFAFLIVGILWIGIGGICAFFAYNEFRGQGRFPKRTIEVLRADKAWLQTEARIR
jgi:uncharacterized membrane protein YqjE